LPPGTIGWIPNARRIIKKDRKTVLIINRKSFRVRYGLASTFYFVVSQDYTNQPRKVKLVPLANTFAISKSLGYNLHGYNLQQRNTLQGFVLLVCWFHKQTQRNATKGIRTGRLKSTGFRA
jgi:hypothetical protein